MSETQAVFLLVMRKHPKGLDWLDAINAARAQGGGYRTVMSCVRKAWVVEATGSHLLFLTYHGSEALERAENAERKRRLYARG